MSTSTNTASAAIYQGQRDGSKVRLIAQGKVMTLMTKATTTFDSRAGIQGLVETTDFIGRSVGAEAHVQIAITTWEKRMACRGGAFAYFLIWSRCCFTIKTGC